MEKSFTNANWSAHAKTYSSVFISLTHRWAVDSLQIAHHIILHKLQQHEAKNSTTPFHFLDVGCGPGVLSFEFARRYLTIPTKICITASDLSDGMLQQVRDNLKEDPTLFPFASKFSTLQSNGLMLEEVNDSSVDIIGSNFGLGIFPDRVKGWATARRVLKEDGLLVITTWSEQSSQMVWFDQLTEMFNIIDGEGEPLERPSLTAGTDQLRVSKELREAGFRNVKVFSTTHTIVFDDPKAIIQANMNNPATIKFLERLTKEQIEQTLTEMLEKDAQKNFYQEEEETEIASTDHSLPRLIPFIGFTILAWK
ncbi:putative ubiE/COQ5 methyltransferase, S-adenosyl-L-methionine-dependent methyltransferase [Plasmopara halstedii]